MLTASDVSAALGAPGAPKLQPDDALGADCRWSTAETNPTTLHLVLLTANLCKVARQLGRQTSGANKYFGDLGQGGTLHSGTLDVITSKGCFSVLGTGPGYTRLPDEVMVAAARAVLIRVG